VLPTYLGGDPPAGPAGSAPPKSSAEDVEATIDGETQFWRVGAYWYDRVPSDQVFGELFMLLEADKRGPKHAVTPLYRRHDDETFSVPENVLLISTMNIADRSLALVDFALRRRFAFITLEPRFGDVAFRKWLTDRKLPESVLHLIIQRLSALNERIGADAQLGPAFRVGHSFFCPRGDDFSGLGADWYREIVHTEIGPLLDEYWYDAPEKARLAKEALLA